MPWTALELSGGGVGVGLGWGAGSFISPGLALLQKLEGDHTEEKPSTAPQPDVVWLNHP